MNVLAALPIDREAARELARDELSKPEYHRDDPTLLQRVGEWLQDRLGDLVDLTAEAAPGGAIGLFVLLALAVLVVAVVLHRMGGVRRADAAPEALLAGRLRTPDEHRAQAEQDAAAGRYDLAIRERLRAVAREFETRGVLEPRPGRTADELARDGGAARPEVSAPLRAAVLVFDEVWYGGRTATADAYATVVRADEAVRGARAGAR